MSSQQAIGSEVAKEITINAQGQNQTRRQSQVETEISNMANKIVMTKGQTTTDLPEQKQSLLFDSSLKSELSNIALNQLDFFQSINQWYSQLLFNDQYSNKQANNISDTIQTISEELY